MVEYSRVALTSKVSPSDNIRHVQDPVVIEANYFSHPYDMAVLVRAIKDSLLIGQSSHFKQFGAKFYDKPLDQCSQVLQIYLCIRIWVLRQNVASHNVYVN